MPNFKPDTTAAHPGPPERPLTRAALREVLAVSAVCAGLLIIIEHGGRALGLQSYATLLITLVLIAATLRQVDRDSRGVAHYGIAMGGWLDPRAPRPTLATLSRAFRESAYALLVTLLVFPIYSLGYAWWHHVSLSKLSMPPNMITHFAEQVCWVALPEEFFFRGYCQTRLTDAFARTRTVLGVRISWFALVLQAALFAAFHLISTPHPARLAVFIPGLWFGFLRAWRGGVGVAILVHAAINTLA